MDAGTSSVVLAASNTLDHDNDTEDDDADAEDTAGKKTLMRDATAEGTGGGASVLVVILPLRDDDIGGGPYDSASALSVSPRCPDYDEAPRHRRPSLLTHDNDGASAPSVTPCLCNDGDGKRAQEGSRDGASTPSIAPCLSVAATLLWVVPHPRKREGGMMRGFATASRRVARGGGMRRAGARWRQRDKR